jgi:hypothetical protein
VRSKVSDAKNRPLSSPTERRAPELRFLIGQEWDRGEPALPSSAKAGWRIFLSRWSSSED